MIPNNQTTTVSVTIHGKEYLIACEEHEQTALINSAAYLNQKMREIRDSGKVIGTDRIAVMAAINIAHELLSADSSNENTQNTFGPEIKRLQDKIEDALYKNRQLEL